MSGFIQTYLDGDERWLGGKPGDRKPLPDNTRYFLIGLIEHKKLRSKVLLPLPSMSNFIPFSKTQKVEFYTSTIR